MRGGLCEGAEPQETDHRRRFWRLATTGQEDQVFPGKLAGRIPHQQVASLSQICPGVQLLRSWQAKLATRPAAGLSSDVWIPAVSCCVSPTQTHRAAFSAPFHRVTKPLIADGWPRARVSSPDYGPHPLLGDPAARGFEEHHLWAGENRSTLGGQGAAWRSEQQCVGHGPGPDHSPAQLNAGAYVFMHMKACAPCTHT